MCRPLLAELRWLVIPIYAPIQTLTGIASDRDEDCYDSNLPNGCYFIFGRPLSTQHFASQSAEIAYFTTVPLESSPDSV